MKPAALWARRPRSEAAVPRCAGSRPPGSVPRGGPAIDDAHQGLCYYILLAVGLLLIIGNRASAAPRARAVLVLVPGAIATTFAEGIREDPRFGPAGGYGAGAMNAAVLGIPSREAAYATIGAGRRLHWPLEPEETAFVGSLAGSCRAAEKRVAYLGPPGDGTARPGMLVLGQVQPEGGLPAEGLSSQPEAAARQVLELLRSADLVVVDWAYAADTVGAMQVVDALLPGLDPQRDVVLMVSPDPGAPRGSGWSYLAPLVAAGGLGPRPDETPATLPKLPGHVLSSSTTRTPGLTANVDIAPTLLRHLGLPLPEGMEGHPLYSGSEAANLLAPLAEHAHATNVLMVPGLIAWGAFAVGALAWGILALLRRPSRRILTAGRVLLGAAAAFLPAILLAGFSYSTGALDLASRIVVLWAVVTLGAAVLFRRSPYLGVLALITALILFDLYLNGGRMLARNLMSDFANIGARFYGIGNEYEGLLLGTTLLVPFWAEWSRAARQGTEPERFSREGLAGTALLWLLAIAAVGAASLGADFGGAVAFALAYLAAGFLAAGRKPRPHEVLIAGGLIAVAAVGFVWLDLSRPPGSRSHVGELAARALREGGAPVWEIASRKVLLNARTALSPYFLGGVAAVTPFLWLWYHRQGKEALQAIAARPLLQRGIQAALLGGVAVLVLNDTGVVAWAFASGAALVFAVDLLQADRLTQLAENERV